MSIATTWGLESERRRVLSAVAKLNTAAAVRERCGMVRDWVADGRSSHFALDETRLAAVAAYVADVTRESYPGLNIPAHSRWRHFAAGGVDRWNTLVTRIHEDAVERARIAADLATVSVLLDAGAGDRWRYRERASGVSFARSEGLAVASFDMFRAGAFSSDPDRPWRVDAAALARIDAATLARHFQVDAENPLVGLEQRSTLLRRLGKALVERSDLFGPAPARPGNLIDYFFATASERRVSVARLLTTLLDGLSSIWPSALMAEGRPIGDAGRHPAVCAGDGTDGIVPFHKLSQWLAYSLFAPLEAAALAIRRDPPARGNRSASAARRCFGAHRRMARAHRRADGSVGRFGASKIGAGRELRHAAAAAGRHLERGTQDCARVAPARWGAAHCSCRRRHRLLTARPVHSPRGTNMR